MKQFSITRRTVTIVILFQLLLTAGLTTVAILYARVELRGAFDTALEGRAMSALALVRYTETAPFALVFDPTLLPSSVDPDHQDLFRIRQDNGSFAAQSSRWPSAAIDSGGRFSNFAVDGIQYRSVTFRGMTILDPEEDVPEPLARLTVTYAASLTPVRQSLTHLAVGVTGISLFLAMVVSIVTVWSIRRELAPLRELAVRANSISIRNWNFQPPPDAALATELSPLVTAIASVLDRLKESFQQQRDFTSDAAHELKTSVAIVKSTLQILLQRPRTLPEYLAGLERIQEDCGRLEDLLERMLRLARLEQSAGSGAPRKRAETELLSTCEASIARVRALADAKNVSVVLRESTEVNLFADPEDLELIWVNLLENAIQYSNPSDAVDVRIRRNGDTVRVSVEDSGPGIPVEELPLIFNRFYRADQSRSRSTGGFGLGLAICKIVVQAYGGRIEAVNRPERGAVVHVDLPIQPIRPPVSGSVPS